MARKPIKVKEEKNRPITPALRAKAAKVAGPIAKKGTVLPKSTAQRIAKAAGPSFKKK